MCAKCCFPWQQEEAHSAWQTWESTPNLTDRCQWVSMEYTSANPGRQSHSEQKLDAGKQPLSCQPGSTQPPMCHTAVGTCCT